MLDPVREENIRRIVAVLDADGGCACDECHEQRERQAERILIAIGQ